MSSFNNFEGLYREMRHRIYLLEYPPGMALKEVELAEEFGVSRTPIRRVLHALEFDGLVTSRRGVGTLVTTIDIRSLKEVYALRLKLHALVGELSSPRVTEDALTSLDELRVSVEEMLDHYDPRKIADLYLEFHEIMLTLITNRPLRQFTDQLFHQTARVWLQILPDLDWNEEVENFLAEMRDVIKALRANDIKTMAHVRRTHLAMVLHRVNKYLSDADLGS